MIVAKFIINITCKECSLYVKDNLYEVCADSGKKVMPLLSERLKTNFENYKLHSNTS